MEKWLKEKSEKINWFLDFIQKDLSNLSPGDRAKLCYEAKEIMFDYPDLSEAVGDDQKKGKYPHETTSTLDLDEVPYPYDVPNGEPPVEVQEWQESFDVAAYMDAYDRWRYQQIPDIQNLEEYFQKLKDMQQFLKWYINRCIREIAIERKPFHFFGVTPEIVALPKVDGISISYVASTSDANHFALLKFANLLDGIPLGGFKKCLECKKIFFYPHRRKKGFCTLECSWRYFARQRRESNPEAYRKYQAELMKKRYREKKRKEYGPKVKIATRKRRKD